MLQKLQTELKSTAFSKGTKGTIALSKDTIFANTF